MDLVWPKGNTYSNRYTYKAITHFFPMIGELGDADLPWFFHPERFCISTAPGALVGLHGEAFSSCLCRMHFIWLNSHSDGIASAFMRLCSADDVVVFLSLRPWQPVAFLSRHSLSAFLILSIFLLPLPFLILFFFTSTFSCCSPFPLLFLSLSLLLYFSISRFFFLNTWHCV